MTFLLGDNCREQAKRSIKSLVAHSSLTSEDASPRVLLYLVINTKTPVVRKTDQIPRIIPLTNKLHKIDEKTIALITRNSSYRSLLTEKDSPTDDLFHNIIPYTKVKLIGHNNKARLRLFKENDLIIADEKIYRHLPDILGPQFYARNKKVPFKILMSKTSPNKLMKTGTELAFDGKFIRAQVKSILGNTSFIPPAGTCIHIAIGYSDWKTSQLLLNLNDVISYLTEEKYRPFGGLISRNNLHSVLLKTSESVALPVMEFIETEENESELSDF